MTTRARTKCDPPRSLLNEPETELPAEQHLVLQPYTRLIPPQIL